MHFQAMNRQDTLPAALLMRDQQTSDALRMRFEAGGIAVNLATGDGGQAAGKHAGHLRDAGLVVIDLAGEPAPHRRLQQLFEFTSPRVPVVVLGDPTDLAYARQLRHHGASEYFSHPLEADELILAARRLLQLEDTGGARNGRLIAVHGLRGGVGASLITAGLANIISQQYGRSCAAVDLNFTSPSVGSWLSCDQPGRLNALLQDVSRLDQALLDQIVQSPFPQLNVYDGHIDQEAEAEPHTAGIQALGRLLAERHSCQLWRTPSGPAVQATLQEANLCVLVADGSFPSLRAALLLLPWIKQHRPTLRTLVVFNQSRPHMPLNAEQFADSIGQAVQHCLSYQRRLSEQTVANLPFNHGRHVLNRMLAKLATDLLDMPAPKSRWWQAGGR